MFLVKVVKLTMFETNISDIYPSCYFSLVDPLFSTATCFHLVILVLSETKNLNVAAACIILQ